MAGSIVRIDPANAIRVTLMVMAASFIARMIISRTGIGRSLGPLLP